MPSAHPLCGDLASGVWTGGGVLQAEELTDVELAREIGSRRLDILINLNGFHEGERTSLFSLRAAPVQATAGVAWAASCGCHAW